jgi:hypothetical protein
VAQAIVDRTGDRSARGRLLAALVFLLWLVHAVDLVLRGDAHDLLWICNVAGPVLAFGALRSSPSVIAVPLLWLCFGTPLWALEMAMGGEIMPSSFASHLGVLVVGLFVVRRLGFPRGAWWKAVAAQVVLLFFTRLVTPPGPNVNLAHRVWAGWEDVFPSYAVYFAALLAGSAALYALLEALLRRLAPVREAS